MTASLASRAAERFFATYNTRVVPDMVALFQPEGVVE